MKSQHMIINAIKQILKGRDLKKVSKLGQSTSMCITASETQYWLKLNRN